MQPASRVFVSVDVLIDAFVTNNGLVVSIEVAADFFGPFTLSQLLLHHSQFRLNNSGTIGSIRTPFLCELVCLLSAIAS
ncbi:hypothetical protein HC248_01893 [Polaromonas vacuolata]|uniref:Uncharacterized protein n=1 Tax=Polaromonas vacuolata TaxID=37448 RepID=A0A6H2H9P9_9BURK|nr:hypothetical protein HC248_01893 [Polaromonas vacuolata]